jgi:hypothetical protein
MADYFSILSFLRVFKSDEKGKRAFESPAIKLGFFVSGVVLQPRYGHFCTEPSHPCSYSAASLEKPVACASGNQLNLSNV